MFPEGWKDIQGRATSYPRNKSFMAIACGSCISKNHSKKAAVHPFTNTNLPAGMLKHLVLSSGMLNRMSWPKIQTPPITLSTSGFHAAIQLANKLLHFGNVKLKPQIRTWYLPGGSPAEKLQLKKRPPS